MSAAVQHLAEQCKKHRGSLHKLNVVSTTLYLVQQVEQLRSGLTGREKKDLVVNTLLKLASDIADEDDPDESVLKKNLEYIIISIIPGVIDALIQVDKSKIRINPKMSRWWCC